MCFCLSDSEESYSRGYKVWGGGDLVVTATAVGDDFHAREGKIDVGGGGREQLFAGLYTQHAVLKCQHGIPKRHRLLQALQTTTPLSCTIICAELKEHWLLQPLQDDRILILSEFIAFASWLGFQLRSACQHLQAAW